MDSRPATTADRSIPRPHASAAAASAQLRRPRADQGYVHADLAIEAVQHHPCSRAVHRFEPRRDVDHRARAGDRLERKGNPSSRRGSHHPAFLHFGSSAFTTASPPETSWRNSLALALPSGNQCLGRRSSHSGDIR